MMKRNKGFAIKFDREEKPFQYFGKSRGWVELHTNQSKPIPVIVEEKKGGGYWAWWDNEKETFCWLWGSKFQVEMCFPDFGKHSIATGRGDIIEVQVIEV